MEYTDDFDGTRAVCKEAEALFPGIVTADVKHEKDHDLCSGLDPESAYRLTAQRIDEAIKKAKNKQIAPYKPTLPMTVTVRMKKIGLAQNAAKKPHVRMIDDYTVECTVYRQCDVVKWIIGTGLPD